MTAEANTRPGSAPISARRSGSIQFWTRTLIPTTREAPAEASAPSHVLLHRAGFIRPVGGAAAGGSGVYDYLPLAWRVLRKINRIVREEMDAAGASELLMPALEPIELFSGTKRDVDYGDLLFKVKDRHGRVAALAPTHEEVITELLKGAVQSYKQFPLNLYQVQSKFRDEFRPRAGLLRCREFVMKDAYSFHLGVEGVGGLNETYDAMYRAYSNIFTRCGLDFTVVEAESGPIGGSASHEFMVNCESGEDTILKCPVSGYAANVEKCETGDRPRGSFQEPPTGELIEVHTPDLPGIDEVGKFMGVKPNRMLKTIVFKAAGGAGGSPDVSWVVAVVRGDHDVNEGKVRSASGRPVALAVPGEAAKAGFSIGYVSPRVVNSVPGVLLLVDPDASVGGFWATGADKPDHHIKHFNWRREVGAKLDDSRYVKVADVRNARAGDPSPRASGAVLVTGRGIEVGHIFKLGSKYSDAMGFTILDRNQQKQSVIMGCYGIGVSRTMAACVEMSNDADGIIWPVAIAPYHVIITLMKPEASDHRSVCERLARGLADAGADVLIDDRDERPGVKFKDADLVGIPLRLTIGDKALAEDAVEFKLRHAKGKSEFVKLESAVGRCVAALNT
jgi:prolyl-tRNA synthetase